MPQLSLIERALVPLAVRGDHRGKLVAVETGREAPFDVARVYFIYGTDGAERGFHAHRTLDQLAICVHGACTLLLDDGLAREEVRLATPDRAVRIAPMIWHEMRDFTPDCVFLVLASAHYDEADYIRDYDQFLALLGPR